MPDAFLAHGTTVTYDSVAVGGIQNISIGEATAGEAEYTSNDTPGRIRKFLKGFIDPGTLTLTCRFRATDPGQLLIRNDFASEDCDASIGKEVVITLPECASDSEDDITFTFDAWPSSVGSVELPQDADEVASQTLTLRLTSLPELSSS